MKLSARNMIKGEVKEITEGMVNDEIIISLPNGLEIGSVITKFPAKNLKLEKGKKYSL